MTVRASEPPRLRCRAPRQPAALRVILTSIGLSTLPCLLPTGVAAQTPPPNPPAPDASAATAGQKVLRSDTIVRDPLTGKAIIIVGGSGRTDPIKGLRDPNGVGALNPQPLPPDPPPDIVGRRTLDLPAAAGQKPR
jgi:hypothetical protein